MLGLISLARIDSPLGPMIAGAVDEGICLLEFDDMRSQEERSAALASIFALPSEFAPQAVFGELGRELEEYFAGERRSFGLPLVARGSPFQEMVWSALLAIPYGETRSYSQIANAISERAASRAVAGANARNRIAILIPCHRVIGADGALRGYNGGAWRKARLLALETSPASGLRGLP